VTYLFQFILGLQNKNKTEWECSAFLSPLNNTSCGVAIMFKNGFFAQPKQILLERKFPYTRYLNPGRGSHFNGTLLTKWGLAELIIFFLEKFQK